MPALTYSTGTVSVTPGSRAVTGLGTLFLTSQIRAGDIFELAGLTLSIESVNSNLGLTLVRPWPGPALSGEAYEVRFSPDTTRVMASSRIIQQLLSSGNFAALANLVSASDQLPYFNGPGSATTTPITATARDLLAAGSVSAVRNLLGLAGYAGAGIRIQGVVDNTGALPATGNTIGDAYLVGSNPANLYVWGGAAPWSNAGPVSGTAGTDGAIPFASRSAAAAGAANIPSGISELYHRDGTALVIRSRAAFADDPLFDTGSRWGVVQRQDTGALAHEVRNGRVWVAPTANPSGQTPPTGTNRILATDGGASFQIWRPDNAPNSTTETATLVRDANNQWWQVAFDSRTLQTAITTLSDTVNPVFIDIVETSSAGDRNAALWSVAPRFRRVTAAIIQGAPPQLGNVNTTIQTADVETVYAPGGTRTTWRDDVSGRVFARTTIGGTISAWAEQVSTVTRDADNLARTNGDTANNEAIQTVAQNLASFILLSPAVQTIGRGDSAVIAEMDGVPVFTFNRQGQGRVVLDQWTLDNLASRLEISGGGGGGGGGSPVSPDVLGNIDGWNAWQSDGLTTFTANLEGGAREYIMRAGEDAWVNGRSEVPIRLLYGDEMGSAGVSAGALVNPYNVATLNDGAGQAGLGGFPASAPTAGIQRAGMGFASIVADLWVEAQAVARWALARAENVAGATLAELAAGQPMTNLSRALTEAERVLADYRRTGVAESVTIMHGAGDDSASYAANFLAMMNAINTNIGPRRINLFQPSGTTEKANFASAEGLLQAFRDKGTLPVTLVSPTYWCGIAAGTIGVIDAVSMTMLAELEARAALDDNWIAPLAFYAERSGSVINIDFEVMPDVSMIAPTSGLFVDGGTISAATIVPDPVTGRLTRLRINLTSTPSAPVTVRYCRGPGARFTGNMRDSWSAPSITGGTLYRRACSFQFEV